MFLPKIEPTMLLFVLFAASVAAYAVDSIAANSTKTPVDPRLLFVQFNRVSCRARNGREGTCYNFAECLRQGGSNGGACALGFGICCVLQKTCGATTSAPTSYFVNPSSPNDDTQARACQLNVNIVNRNVCQLRLDFESFKLAAPTPSPATTGPFRCQDHQFTVRPNTGGNLGFTDLCGDNAGQHIYVPVDNSQSGVQLAVTTSGSTAYNWRIKVTQLDCSRSTTVRAPDGCLQYYTDQRGSFESFGFANGAGKYPAGLNYAVCVRRASGTCGVRYSSSNFHIAAADPGVQVGNVGCDSSASSSGGTATTTMSPSTGDSQDFLFIPQGRYDTTSPEESKFCGDFLQSNVVTSRSPGPIVVSFTSDDRQNEAVTLPETGFRVNYEQLSTC